MVAAVIILSVLCIGHTDPLVIILKNDTDLCVLYNGQYRGCQSGNPGIVTACKNHSGYRGTDIEYAS